MVPKLEDIGLCVGNTVKITKIKDKHFHTNHFLKGNGSSRKSYLKDDKWKWSNKRDRDESEERYIKLKESTTNLLDYESIKKILQNMAAEKKYKGHTSGSIFFEMSKSNAFCESIFYFDGSSHKGRIFTF